MLLRSCWRVALFQLITRRLRTLLRLGMCSKSSSEHWLLCLASYPAVRWRIFYCEMGCTYAIGMPISWGLPAEGSSLSIGSYASLILGSYWLAIASDLKAGGILSAGVTNWFVIFAVCVCWNVLGNSWWDSLELWKTVFGSNSSQFRGEVRWLRLVRHTWEIVDGLDIE